MIDVDDPQAVCMQCGESNSIPDYLPRVFPEGMRYECPACGHWNRDEPPPDEQRSEADKRPEGYPKDQPQQPE